MRWILDVSQCERNDTANRNGCPTCYRLLSISLLYLAGTTTKIRLSSGFSTTWYSNLDGSTPSRLKLDLKVNLVS